MKRRRSLSTDYTGAALQVFFDVFDNVANGIILDVIPFVFDNVVYNVDNENAAIAARRHTTTMADPVVLRDEDDGEQETWDDWVDDGNDASFACVFCADKFSNEDALHAHLDAAHSFSLKQHIAARKLDTYATIQLVNFLRQMTLDGVSVAQINQVLDSEGDAAFKKDQFLKPVLVDDPLLYCLDCDDFSDDDSGNEDEEQKTDHVVTQVPESSAAAIADPADRLAMLERENRELKLQMSKYSRLVHDFVAEDDVSQPVVPATDNDTYYFDSYSHVGIHREMITDKIRTDAYRNAILNNPELFKGKVVLDVGCGTGILSMFAAQAGAAKVIGIDRSEMGIVAQDIVNDNGFGDMITIIRGKVEEIELPVDKVDVIISEWMGYCLLYESMLDTVLFARDKWLAPGGYLFPDKCSMHIQGIQDSTDRVQFWDEVYGFNMKAIKSKISIRDAFIEDVPASDVITDRALLQNIDIDHVKYDDLDFHSDFTLHFAKDATMHGFVSSFDIGFERGCSRPEYFTTGVEGTPTHWHQVFFHVEKPFHVRQGEVLAGKWWVRRNAENPRFLDVEIEWKREGETEFAMQSYRIH
ncbi:Arginine n-methyltransferase, partial [Globisporangium splendens]